MKIFNVVLISLLFVASVTVNAQKVKKEVVGNYKYTQLPSDLALKSYKTYKVTPHGEDVDSYVKDAIESAVKLVGFEKKGRNSDDVDFRVDAEKYPLKSTKPERSTSEKTKKVDGVEKVTKYYTYSSTVSYKYVSRIYLNGDKIYEKHVDVKETVRGNRSTSSSTAYTNYSNELKKFKQDADTEHAGSIGYHINEIYGYPVKNQRLMSAHIKPKKHSYDDYETVFASMREGYIITSEDEDAIEAAKPSLEKAIQGFEELLKEADIENKKARINKDVTALVYLNIANCHFMLKNYTAAADAATKGTEVKRGLYNTKTIISVANKMQKRVEINAE